MNQAQIRFHAELNDFLPRDNRQNSIVCAVEGKPSVKHLIESLGIPHTEVYRILVNDNPVNFAYHVQDGDHIHVYPASVNFGASEGVIQSQPAGERRFILDNHLGKLAAYLRMLGFDTLYRNDYQDEELARVASQRERILLTRDRRLLMRSVITYGYWVREKAPRRQLLEVTRRYDLFPAITPFRRCMRCNGILQATRKEEVLHRLEPLTKLYFEEFHVCSVCDRVYWRGSHFERMQQFIEQLFQISLGKEGIRDHSFQEPK